MGRFDSTLVVKYLVDSGEVRVTSVRWRGRRGSPTQEGREVEGSDRCETGRVYTGRVSEESPQGYGGRVLGGHRPVRDPGIVLSL